jgi:cytochrome c553
LNKTSSLLSCLIPARPWRLLLAMLVGLGFSVSAAFASNAPKGDKAFGEYLSSLCVTCHQISGQSTGGIPPIVAWPDEQFIAVLNSYRWKERENEVMQNIAAQLGDEEIAALAAYFGSLPNKPKVK